MSSYKKDSRWGLILCVLLAVSAFAGFAAFAQTAQDTTYTVRPGDSLDLIGAAFDVQVACLAFVNEIDPQAPIYAGDELMISYSCPPYDGSSTTGTRVERDLGQGGGGYPVIFVTHGDTLDSIAMRYNISLASLLMVNDMTIDARIRSGDQLVIPVDAPPYGYYPALSFPDGVGGGSDAELYVIQPRDILDLIAAYFDVDLACLATANSIENPALVQPGQAVFIPSTCPVYAGLSSALTQWVRGLNLNIGQGTPEPVLESTPSPTFTLMPTLQPTLAVPTLMPTLVVPTATVVVPTLAPPTQETLPTPTSQQPLIIPSPTTSG